MLRTNIFRSISWIIDRLTLITPCGARQATMERIEFEPTVVWRARLDAWDERSHAVQQSLAKHVNGSGITLSNRGGWHSDVVSHVDAALEDVINEVTDLYRCILAQLGWRSAGTAEVTCECWININPPGAWNIVHTHPGWHMGAVLFIDSPPACGDLRIIGLRESLGLNVGPEMPSEAAASEPFLRRGIDISPRQGDLFLFPGWLPHQVLPNRSDADRISIAFNLNCGLDQT